MKKITETKNLNNQKDQSCKSIKESGNRAGKTAVNKQGDIMRIEKGEKEMLNTLMNCYGSKYSFLLCDVMSNRIKEVKKLCLVKNIEQEKLFGYFDGVVGVRQRTENQRKVVKEIKLILIGTPEQPVKDCDIDLDLFYNKVVELIEYTSNEIECMNEAGMNIINKELPEGSDELKGMVNYYKDRERRDFMKVYDRYDKIRKNHKLLV